MEALQQEPEESNFETAIPEIAEQLVTSKAYKTPSGTTYPSPREFLSILPKDFVISAVKTEIGSVNVNDDKTENTAFSRWMIVSKSAGLENAEYHHEIGMMVAYDLSKPLIKIFSGTRVSACLNLSVFSSHNILKIDIVGDLQKVIQELKDFITRAEQDHRNNVLQIIMLKETRISSREKLAELFGQMMFEIVSGKSKVGIQAMTAAMQKLIDPSARYFYSQENNSAWNVFNSITQHNTDKSNFFEVPEKSLAQFELLTKFLVFLN